MELGCGVCGLVCAEHVARHPGVDELILADIRTDAAQELADRLASGKVSVREVNGTDREDLIGLLNGCDLVIASMPWRLNKMVMELSAELGVHYLDFGMPFDSTGPEFDRYSDVCREAGVSALVGMGMEPGISDVLAMYCSGKLDRADEAHVFDGDTASVEGMEFFSSWSPIDLFDETSVSAAVFRDGRIEFVPPLSEKEVYEFPEPVGPRTVYKTNHDETYFMPMGIKTLREASFNIHIDDGFAQAATLFRKFGLLSREPVNVKGVRVRPLDLVATMMPSPVSLGPKMKGHMCFVVEVTGVKGDKKARVKTWVTKSYEDTFARYSTNPTGYLVGTGGAVAAEMLIDGEVKEKGIVIPEQLDHASYLARLSKKDVEVEEEVIDL